MTIDNFDVVGKKVVRGLNLKYNADMFYTVKVYRIDENGKLNIHNSLPFKEYYVNSSVELTKHKDEIVELCDKMNCCALIFPNQHGAHKVNGDLLKMLTNEYVDKGRMMSRPWDMLYKAMNLHDKYGQHRTVVTVSNDIDWKKVVDVINKFSIPSRLKSSCTTDVENPSMNFIRRVESDKITVFDNAICVLPKNDKFYDVLVYCDNGYDITDLERHINSMMDNPNPYIICNEDDYLTLYRNC